jgi:adenine phosphoribosyltransferase
MEAAYELIKKFGVKKVYINFLAELDGLNGRRLFDANAQIDSLIHY